MFLKKNQNVDIKKFPPAAASLCRRSFCREKYLRKAFWITWIFDIWSPGYSIFDHMQSRWMISFKRGDKEQKMVFVCQQGRGYDCWKLEKHSHPGMVVELPLPHLLQQEQLRKENRDPGFCLRFDLFNFWSGLMWKAKGHGCWSNLLDRANLGKSLS